MGEQGKEGELQYAAGRFLVLLMDGGNPTTFTNPAILTKGPMELLMQEMHFVPKATASHWEGRGRESLSLILI